MALTKEEARLRRLASMKRWRNSHAEEKAAYQKAWNAAHKEEKKEYLRSWYAANPEWSREHSRRWRAEHREEANTAALARYYANKEKYLEQSKRWQLEHPERWQRISKIHTQRRRAQKRGAECEKVISAGVFERDGWHCRTCGCETLREWERYNIWSPELDHIIPLARGGAHTHENTQLLCHRCNARKAARLPEEMKQDSAA